MFVSPDIVGQVVPTHVGVNRSYFMAAIPLLRCPHTRGGEPGESMLWVTFYLVVPTHVGVNQIGSLLSSIVAQLL